MPPFRLRRTLASAFAVSVFLAACGSSDVATTPTSVDSSSTSTDAETTATSAGGTGDDVDLSSKPEVVVPDGPAPKELVIEDLIVGEGPEAEPGDFLEMHYVGVRHSDGGQFDASWDRGSTLSLALGAGMVIEGWDEGLVGMREGGRRLLSIPADLAYGDEARSADIPANSALVFVVDLVELITEFDVENAPAPATELEVSVLEDGDGDVVEAGDVVELHYVVVLQSTGDVVDSSFAQGQSVSFVIGLDQTQSLAGWDEGLVGKRVGDHVRLVIPPELGFGDRGGNIVAPDETIVTEVRIMGIGG